MRTSIPILIAVLLVGPFTKSFGASTLPIAFERGYRNNAWGYQNYGCFVDLQRNIYTYDETKPAPFKHIGRAPISEYTRAWTLLRALSKAPFAPGTKTHDGGILTWSAFYDGHPILIKKAGDIAERRDSPHLKEVIELINTWCPKSLLPSLPE